MGKEIMKLHLGCGYKHLPGFQNVDANPEVNPDIVDNILILEKFENNSVDLIYVCHVFEHFSYDESATALRRWSEILKRDGILRLSVPDMEALMKIYLFYEDLNIIKHMICGSQQNEWQFHKNCWDFKTLKDKLEKFGFKDVKRWEWQDIDPHRYVDDYAQSYYPDYHKRVKLSNGKTVDLGGRLMSLNIEAKKQW